jgi:hypothetical protein
MKPNSHIKVGELEIPMDYFKLEEEDKKEICSFLLDTILNILDKELNPMTERIEVLKVLLESSIITNEKDETYEVAAVLRDIKKLVDEQNN